MCFWVPPHHRLAHLLPPSGAGVGGLREGVLVFRCSAHECSACELMPVEKGARLLDPHPCWEPQTP